MYSVTTVQKTLKSVMIWQSYNQVYRATFLCTVTKRYVYFLLCLPK